MCLFLKKPLSFCKAMRASNFYVNLAYNPVIEYRTYPFLNKSSTTTCSSSNIFIFTNKGLNEDLTDTPYFDYIISYQNGGFGTGI